jgi:hypothetical protein
MSTRAIRDLRPSWLLALALASLVFIAGLVPRAHAQANECLVSLETQGDVVVDDNDTVPCCAPYCTTDGKKCTFTLRACANQAASGCEAGDIKKVVARSKCGGTRGFRLKPGTNSVCGAFTDVKVRTKKRGRKPGKCKFSLRVKAKGRPARKDVDAATLVCDPTPVCPTTTTTTTSLMTTTTICIPSGCCGCLPSQLSFTTGAPGGGSTGEVEPAVCVQGSNNGTACTTDGDCTGGGVCRGHLDIGGLYFGSGQPAGINLPASIPDLSVSYTNIASCSNDDPILTATVAADIPAGCSVPSGTPAQGSRHCTSAGCLFGSPLPIPNLANPPTSTCIINEVATDASGTATCSNGATTLNLPLTSHVYLTGSVLGTQTCALCTGGTVGVCGSGTCLGGTRNGMVCTPEGNALTSHDCPQPAGTFIGDLPIPFNLSTGTQTKVSFATGVQARVFCGFCFDGNISSAYANPPDPCASDAECASRGDAFDTCKQHNNGAFRNPFATTITETGSTAGVTIGDGAPHATTLVSVFCVPPSYDPIVDPSGELPGPGAVSLPGTAQLLP